MPTNDVLMVVDVNGAKLTRNAKRIRSSIDAIGSGFIGAQKNLSSFSKVLGAGLGLGILASLFRSTVNEVLTFDKAMREVNTLINESFGDINELSEAVKILSVEFGQSPTATAQALYQIISAGASDAASAILTLDAAQKLAVGGVTNVALAADGLTSVLTAFGKGAGDLTEITDTMFLAMREGKTTIAELSASVGDFAPVAATAGISMQEMFAAAAALTTGGLSTAQAFTGLRQAVLNILNPTQQAVKLSDFLGQEFEEFEFSAGRLKEVGLDQFLDEIFEATGGATESLIQFFGSVQGAVAIFGLAGPAGEKFKEILKDMSNESGATEKAFQKMLGPMFEVQSLMQNISKAKIDFGEKFARSGHEVLSNINDNFEKIVKSTEKLIVTVVKLKLAIFALRGVAKIFTSMGVAVAKFNASTEKTDKFLRRLTKQHGIRGLLGGITILAGRAAKSFLSFSGILSKVGVVLSVVSRGFGILLGLSIAKWLLDIAYNAGFMREEIDAVAQALDNFVVRWGYVFDVVGETLSLIGTYLKAAFGGLGRTLAHFTEGVFIGIRALVVKTVQSIGDVLANAADRLGFDDFAMRVRDHVDLIGGELDTAVNDWKKRGDDLRHAINVEKDFAKSGDAVEQFKHNISALTKARDRDLEVAKKSTYENNKVASAYEVLKKKISGVVGATKDANEETETFSNLSRDQQKVFQRLLKKITPVVSAQRELELHTELLGKGFVANRFKLVDFALEIGATTEQLEELNAAEKEGIRETELFKLAMEALASSADTTKGSVKDLTAEIENHKRKIQDIIASSHPLLEANLNYQRKLEDVEKSMKAANTTTEDRIKVMAALREEYGRNVDAALDLTEINERIAAVQEMAKDRTKEFAEEIKNMRMEREEDKESAIDWAKVMQDSVERAIDRVNDAFVDLWASAFKGFKDFGKALKDAFVQLLATLAHEAITKPIVMNIAASFTGGLTSGIGSAAGNIVGGLFSGGSSNLIESLGLGALVKGAGNILGGAKGLLSGVLGIGGANAIGAGGSILGSAGGALTPGGIQAASGFEVLAGQSGLTAPLPGGEGLLKGLQSSAVASALSGFLGSKAAELLGLGGGTGGAIGGTAGALVGSAIGGPIGAGIGGFIGSALGGLFGGKPSNKAQIRGFNFNTGDISRADGGRKKFSQVVYDSAETILSEVQLAQQAIEEATGATIGAGSLSFDIGRRDPTKIRVGDRHAETAVGDPVAAFNKIVEFMVDSLEGGSEQLVGVLQDTFDATGDINKAIQAVVAKQEELASLELEVSVLKEALSVFATVLEDDPVTKALAGISTEVITFEQSLMNLSSNFSSVTDSFLAGDLTLQDFLSSVGTAQNVMVDYANRINAIRVEGTERIDSILNDIYESSLTDSQLVDRRWDELGSVLEMIDNTTDPGELQRLINMVASQTQEALGIVSRLDEAEQEAYTSDFEGLLLSAKTRFEEQLNESQMALENANLQMREQIILANDHVVALHEDAAMRHEEAANAQMIAAETNKKTADTNAATADANSETATANSETAGILYSGANIFSGAVTNFGNTNITVSVDSPQVAGYWGVA